MGAPRVTLADVAEKAGLSISTISMVLGGRSDMGFAPQTVEKVKEAAASLGYKSPRHENSFGAGQLLIITPNISNPYYATIVQAIQQGAADAGIGTLIKTTYRHKGAEEAILKNISHSSIAGIVFTMQPQCVKQVERASFLRPLVVIGDRAAALNVDTVELDNYDAGLMLGRHMTELGHRNAAYISTPLNAANSARVRRLEGIRAAFAEVGGSVLVKTMDVTPKEELNNISIEHNTGFALGKECLREKGITALMAVNDMVAYGVLAALAEAGKKVPDDYSVSGFDNTFPSPFLPVGLTTVEHYLVEKGRKAFEIVHEKMLGSIREPCVTRVEYSCHLVKRASTGVARHVFYESNLNG